MKYYYFCVALHTTILRLENFLISSFSDNFIPRTASLAYVHMVSAQLLPVSRISLPVMAIYSIIEYIRKFFFILNYYMLIHNFH